MVIRGRTGHILFINFLQRDNFMKLMYVLHDCVERDIRQRIGIFLSHKVLKLESKEQKPSQDASISG